MGMDITGICQKRIKGKWITIPEKPRLLKEERNREYFIFLLGEMNPIDINDAAIDDLVKEFSWIDDKAELISKRNNFTRPGFLTLSELADMKEDRYNSNPMMHDRLITDLTTICGSSDPKDCRIVFVFDN